MIHYKTKDLDDHQFTDFNYQLDVLYNVDQKADRLAWEAFNAYRKSLHYDTCVASDMDHHAYEGGWTYYRGLSIDFNNREIRDSAVEKLQELVSKYKNTKQEYHCVERAFINCTYNERQTYIDKMSAWLENHDGCHMQAMENFHPNFVGTRVELSKRSDLRLRFSNYICLPVRLIDKTRQLMFKLSWQTKIGISELEVNDAVA